MNFGVVIRSIGERTEQLCYDSVAQCLPKQKIHIVKNYYPSYNAYLKMFQIAKKEKYDWFLGLDADVILKPNWYKLFLEKIADGKCDDLFRIHFYVQDQITEQKLVRGNNFYNGKYTQQSENFLKKCILVGKFWFYFKNKGYNSGYFTKPESSIRVLFRERLNIHDFIFNETIGYHSYEAYYSEIFRQYLTRKKRDPFFSQKPENNFLKKESQLFLKNSKDIDKYIANLAWNSEKDFDFKNIDGRIREKIIKYMKEKYNISENKSIIMNLDTFYKKYNITNADYETRAN